MAIEYVVTSPFRFEKIAYVRGDVVRDAELGEKMLAERPSSLVRRNVPLSSKGPAQ